MPTAIIAFALLAAEDETTRDTLLSQASAVGPRGSARVSASGAGSGSALGAIAGVRWSVGARLALDAAIGWQNDGISPYLAITWQVIEQSDDLVDAAVSVRVRGVGRESGGSDLEGRLAAGRAFGALALLVNAVIGKGLGRRSGVDLEASLAASYGIVAGFRLGAEAQVHGELVDDFKTAGDVGRRVGIIVGPSASAQLGPVRLQLLVGATLPRGFTPLQPEARGVLSVDLR